MLRKMLGWGGGDVNVPCACTHVGCCARCWVGVGAMLTFLALAHMLDATQDAGLGWGLMLTFLQTTKLSERTSQKFEDLSQNAKTQVVSAFTKSGLLS